MVVWFNSLQELYSKFVDLFKWTLCNWFILLRKIWRSFSQEYRAYCLKISDYVRFTTDFYYVLLSNGFNGLKLWDGVKNQGLKLKSDFM